MTPAERVAEALAKKIEEAPTPELVDAFCRLQAVAAPEAVRILEKRMANMEESLAHMDEFLVKNLGAASG